MDQPISPSGASPTQPEIHFCAKCGASRPEGAAFCPACGTTFALTAAALDPSPVQAATVAPGPPAAPAAASAAGWTIPQAGASNSKAIIVVGLIVVAVVVVLLVAYAYEQDQVNRILLNVGRSV